MCAFRERYRKESRFSSHPTRCKNSIPYSQFLRMRRICSDERDFEIKSKEMSAFFRNRGYPSQIIKQARDRVSVIPREDLIPEQVDAAVEQNTIPLVLTYHPTNTLVKNIITYFTSKARGVVAQVSRARGS